jgi:lipopolysaccharide export system permease protein
MLSTVDRYLLSEIVKVFAAIMATLLLVVASMLFLGTLEQVDVGALQADMLLRFVGLQVLRDTATLLAPAAFLAVLMALGRLARDSELIALTAGGIGPARVYRAVLLFALPMVLVAGWFSLVLQPLASAEIERIESSQDDQATRVSGIQAGRFYEQEQGAVTFYTAEVDGDGRFRRVMIQDRRGAVPRLVLCESGYYREGSNSAEQAVVLEFGTRYDGAAGRLDYRIIDFQRLIYFIAAADGGQRWRRAAAPTSELVASDDLRDKVELGHRMASALGVLTLTLLAVPLTQLSPRRRSTGRLFIAFLAYFAFFNGLRVAEEWMTTGVTPPWLGVLWYQLVIVAVVFAALIPGSYPARRLAARFGSG